MAYDAAFTSETGSARGGCADNELAASPIVLGLVTCVQGTRARVRAGTREIECEIDPSVDPALVEQACARGARVVIDPSGPCVVGALATARSLEIDRKGNLEASVKRLKLRAEEALLATPRSFLRLRAQTTELFGDELLVRGRLLTRILGKAIKLN